MSEDHGALLLLGSVARPEDGWDVEQVLRRSAGTLGDHVSMLPTASSGTARRGSPTSPATPIHAIPTC